MGNYYDRDDARNAISATIGSKRFAADLGASIGNINAVTSLIAKRHDAIDRLVTNLDDLVADLRIVSGHVKEITGGLDPKTVSGTLNSLTGAISSMTGVVEQIKKEPVLALSVNKAADRIVKMKFDEMAKQPAMRTSDAVLTEINRWVRDSMQNNGYLTDPSYSVNARPYVMESRESVLVPVPGTEQRPYMKDE